jgi:hypothetical protein
VDILTTADSLRRGRIAGQFTRLAKLISTADVDLVI